LERISSEYILSTGDKEVHEKEIIEEEREESG